METQTTGLNRNVIDKYYTKLSVAKLCCELLKHQYPIHYENDIIIEPSAGNGAFIELLTHMSKNCLFYDIQPEHPSILKQDYLLVDFNKFCKPSSTSKVYSVGNPPFGRQSSLAIKFIKKSAEISDVISFILPKSFKKSSMRNHFPEHFHLVYEQDLDKNSFIINASEERDVPCVFQIWEKRMDKRPVIQKEEALKFAFVKKEENPDISFRRVGVNAGVISTEDLANKSIQSHYFIKFNSDILKEDIIEKIRKIQFETNNTVGPKSISKPEIIREFNILLNS